MYPGVGQAGANPFDWIDLRGRTLRELEGLAIRASFARNKGHRRAMMRELGISKSGLLRKLDALGLRQPRGGEADPEDEPQGG